MANSQLKLGEMEKAKENSEEVTLEEEKKLLADDAAPEQSGVEKEAVRTKQSGSNAVDRPKFDDTTEVVDLTQKTEEPMDTAPCETYP